MKVDQQAKDLSELILKNNELSAKLESEIAQKEQALEDQHFMSEIYKDFEAR